MGIKQTLTSIVLAGALALGTVGCNIDYHLDHSQYTYDGKIGEDKVTFTETECFAAEDDNILTITKPDGRVIKYVDRLKEDLKLEYVQITANGQTTKYTADDEVGKSILKEAQKQFDVYLQKIDEAKAQERKERINQGLENLK